MSRVSPKRVLELIEGGVQQLTQPQASLVPALGAAVAVAEALGLKDEQIWFECELTGYAQRGRGVTHLGEVLRVAEASDLPGRITKYRAVVGTVYVQIGNRPPEEWPYNVLLPDSVPHLEAARGRSGRPYFTVPPEAQPDFAQELMRKFGLAGQPMTVYVSPHQLATAVAGLRAELGRFFATARLLVQDEGAPEGGGRSSATTGAITATNVNIIASSGEATVHVPIAQTLSAPSAIATLRQEVAMIEDLVIGSRKDLTDISAHGAEIREALGQVVDRLEASLAGKTTVSSAELAEAAGDIGRSMANAKSPNVGVLSRILKHEITQSLIASTLFEGLKKAWPFVELAVKSLG